MPAPEEISAWSLEEIRVEIRALLPNGWSLVDDEGEGYWLIRIDRPGEEAPVVEYEESNADERMALLNVFGWLWMRSLPKPDKMSPWNRRRELTREGVTTTVSLGGSQVPDPGDLDPIEIDSVYQPFRK